MRKVDELRATLWWLSHGCSLVQTICAFAEQIFFKIQQHNLFFVKIQMKYMVSIDGSADSELAFQRVLGKATQQDFVFVLLVAEEVYISTVAGASAYIDYSYVVKANQKIEEEGKALLKAHGRRLTERKVYTFLYKPIFKLTELSFLHPSISNSNLTLQNSSAQIPHTLLLGKGEPQDVICSEAEEKRVNLLVLGRRGIGKFQRYATSIHSKCFF